MGQKYCTSSKTMPPILDKLRELTFSQVREKAHEMGKRQTQRGGGMQGLYFIHRKDLQEVLHLSDEEIFHVFSLLSVDGERVQRVGCLDFWGALALASIGPGEEKLSFCCRLIDTNRDEHLSLNEVVILLICVTRGLSRLKGFQIIPEDILDRIATLSFHEGRKKLRIDGEISITSFISFALANDTCRTYLATIGAKVPPVDAASMVVKHTHILKELSHVRFRIAETLHKIEEQQMVLAAHSKREGDLPLLKLAEVTPSIVDPSTMGTMSEVTHPPPLSIGTPSIGLQCSHILVDEQLSLPSSLASFPGSTEEELLHSLPKSHPVWKYLVEEDTWKNEMYRTEENNAATIFQQSSSFINSLCSKKFEVELNKHWMKLPHDDDGLVWLDEATLVALCWRVGVHLAYSTAQKCLQTIVTNQLKKYNFDEVLMWLRYHWRSSDSCSHSLAHAFLLLCRGWQDWLSRQQVLFDKTIEKLLYQRRVLSGLVREEELSLAKKLADFRSLLSRQPSVLHWQYLFNVTALREFKAKLKKEGKQQAVKEEKEDDGVTWKTRFAITVRAVPFTNISTKRPADSSRIRLLEHEDGLQELEISEVEQLQPTDVLDYYNALSQRLYYEAQAALLNSLAGEDEKMISQLKKVEESGPATFQSACWLVLDLLPSSHEAQVYLLRQAITNLIQTLPVHLRSALFSHFYVEVCSIKDKTSGKVESKSKRRNSMFASLDKLLAEKVRHDKVILVTFLHTEDHFYNLEQKLILSDIFLSRGVLNATFQLNLINSWHEIYSKSMDFVQYESKLFGPQENELGDELANPLQFAKHVRSRRKEIQRILDTMGEISREELGKHCRDIGVLDSGNRKEVMSRLAEALKAKQELLGHGELSLFGKDIISQAFGGVRQDLVYDLQSNKTSPNKSLVITHANKPVEPSLTLWELNRLLYRSKTSTLYDKKAYKSFVEEQDLLVDRDQQLMLPGLYHYYEANGQLAEDNRHWGIGSLDHLLAGQFVFDAQFEPQAFLSLLNLIESKPIFLPKLFKLAAWLGRLKEHRQEGEVDCISKLLDLFPDLSEWNEIKTKLIAFLRDPGRVAVWLNMLVTWCNNEEIGPLISLRRYVQSLIPILIDRSDHSSILKELLRQQQEVHDKSMMGKKDDNPKEESNGVESEQQNDVEQDKDNSHRELSCDFETMFGEFYLQKVEELLTRKYNQLSQARQSRLAEEAVKNENNRRLSTVSSGAHGRSSLRSSVSGAISQAVNSVYPGTAAPSLTAGTSTAGGDRGSPYNPTVASSAHDTPHSTISPIDPLQPVNEPSQQEQPLATQQEDPEEIALLQRSLLNVNVSIYRETAEMMLPLHLDKAIASKDLEKWRQDIIQDLAFLSNIRSVEGLSLSLDESVAIDDKRANLEQLLEKVTAMQERSESTIPCHALACYDALRLFGKGIMSIGCGTKDFTLRAACEGVDCFTCLPRGMGEDNYIEMLLAEKQERFETRRKAALAAIERERLRRMMTAEDIERIKQAKLRKERLFYEAQDRLFYEEAKRKLDESKEERKTMSELGQIVRLFDQYLKKKESRLAEGLDTIVAKNNLACVMVEIYGVEHPLSESAPFHLQEAAQLLPLSVDDLASDEPTVGANAGGSVIISDAATTSAPSEENSSTTQDQSGQQSAANGHASAISFAPAVSNAAVKALIILNCLDLLHRTESFTALRNATDMKTLLVDCLRCLNEKEKDKLCHGVVPNFCGVAVFHSSTNHGPLLQAIVQELAFSTQDFSLIQLLPTSLAHGSANAALDSSEKDDEKLSEEIVEDDQGSLSLLTKSSAELRKEKRQRYEEQRQKDMKLRAEVSKQRQMLYELIQTDKISEIFAAQAGVAEAAAKAGWGIDEEAAKALEKERDEFTKMASAMAEHSLERSSTAHDSILSSQLSSKQQSKRSVNK